MMLPLLLSLVVSATDDPPVKVWLNHDNYFQRGDKARVNVKLADDGYLLVLRADAEGRVRVLFPLDPSNDNFVRGHETIEVRGRGDREAFFVDDREGSGLEFRRVLFRSDRKSTRLNSSHDQISYAVFCLNKKSTR